MRSLLIYLLATLLPLGCVAANAKDDSSPAKSVNRWPGVPYVRVVGYSFERDPDSPHTIFSLLRDDRFDEAELKKVKTKEAVLKPAQIEQLLKATFAYNRRTRGASCYEPHHIFVFYDRDTHPVGAIEVCFSCRWVYSWPSKDREGNDFPVLAELSWQLGLGLGSPKVDLDWFLKREKEWEQQ